MDQIESVCTFSMNFGIYDFFFLQNKAELGMLYKTQETELLITLNSYNLNILYLSGPVYNCTDFRIEPTKSEFKTV